MQGFILGAVEEKFADIVWDNAPISTADLIKRCEEELNWKRTTTYTVLKRLCEKGLFEMKDRTVSVLVSKKEFSSIQSEKFVDRAFNGSLPSFIAAFTSRKQLSEEEIAAIKKLLEL